MRSPFAVLLIGLTVTLFGLWTLGPQVTAREAARKPKLVVRIPAEAGCVRPTAVAGPTRAPVDEACARSASARR